MKKIEVLKPCPHCGGKAYVSTMLKPTVYIEAKHTENCTLKPNTWLESNRSLAEQAELWNNRSALVFGPADDLLEDYENDTPPHSGRYPWRKCKEED